MKDAEAYPIWFLGDPSDGLFLIFTGGWITTEVPRDLAGNFEFFYTSRGYDVPLWQAYTPDPGFDEICSRLSSSDFSTKEERRELMSQAMELALKDSVRVWIVDRINANAMRQEVIVNGDLFGGIKGSSLWSQTLRRADKIGVLWLSLCLI
jgi:peptide/nickel transport system substrate-binding protein